MENLFEIVKELKGCQIATISYLAQVKIPKKYGILGQVEKACTMQVQIGYNYQNAVNNRLEKQGDEREFVSQPLPWGQWEIENKVITHKGKRYLRCYNFNNSSVYSVEYLVDGRPATASELLAIAEYNKSQKKVSGTQAEAGLTNLEKQVKPMAIKFSSIKELKINKLVWSAAA